MTKIKAPMWTESEDNVIRDRTLTITELERKLPGRSYGAIVLRAMSLECPRKKIGKGVRWTLHEIEILHRYDDIAELQLQLPHRSLYSIKHQRLKIKHNHEQKISRMIWTQETSSLLYDTSKSYAEIQSQIGCSRNSIINKCKQLHLVRSDEAVAKAYSGMSQSDIDNLLNDIEFCSIIDGHLLGDGSIHKNGSFRRSSVDYEYTIKLHEYLCSKVGSLSSILEKEPEDEIYIQGVKTKAQRVFITNIGCAPVFNEFRERWYPNGKKIVPKDIQLNRLVCSRWYIDDGSNQHRSMGDPGRGLRLKLCTESFKLSDVKFLMKKLEENGLITSNSKVRKGQYQIIISSDNALQFLNYIGQSPSDSFAYKWETAGYCKKTYTCVYCGKEYVTFGHEDIKRRVTCGKKECQKARRNEQKRYRNSVKHGVVE